jgi:hypothetical protein
MIQPKLQESDRRSREYAVLMDCGSEALDGGDGHRFGASLG